MVRLTKIYTRSGDAGMTGLGDGSRVRKTDLRVEAYGTVDEANAAVALATCSTPEGSDERAVLLGLQQDLFDVGADLCAPTSPGEKPGERLRVSAEQTTRLEGLIDRFNDGLGELRSFVLPGGTELAARLHVARTVSRRAERLVVELAEREPGGTNPETVKYLNRLSDLLFVLARHANDRGKGDVLWVPGANRGDASGGGS
ncbi:MAG: cob(I)yrinic acid a,c-diamide adenosyltransferase [Phycisphaeraceae bacterium]|nr:MAG: cob(I)yrinic acid a,c-diamide adenosyltransferase [Phycisphaeraceae bacterium]